MAQMVEHLHSNCKTLVQTPVSLKWGVGQWWGHKGSSFMNGIRNAYKGAWLIDRDFLSFCHVSLVQFSPHHQVFCHSSTHGLIQLLDSQISPKVDHSMQPPALSKRNKLEDTLWNAQLMALLWSGFKPSS
jgi:hypothetical protein